MGHAYSQTHSQVFYFKTLQAEKNTCWSCQKTSELLTFCSVPTMLPPLHRNLTHQSCSTSSLSDLKPSHYGTELRRQGWPVAQQGRKPAGLKHSLRFSCRVRNNNLHTANENTAGSTSYFQYMQHTDKNLGQMYRNCSNAHVFLFCIDIHLISIAKKSRVTVPSRCL